LIGESQMKDKVIEILKNVNADVDCENEKSMIDDELLTSFDVVAIIGDLADEFDIDISVDEMVPENFNTIEAICAMVERLIEEQK
jgi:D-alanine--poly(phosphoribitol) ligase subunit 2